MYFTAALEAEIVPYHAVHVHAGMRNNSSIVATFLHASDPDFTYLCCLLQALLAAPEVLHAWHQLGSYTLGAALWAAGVQDRILDKGVCHFGSLP